MEGEGRRRLQSPRGENGGVLLKKGVWGRQEPSRFQWGHKALRGAEFGKMLLRMNFLLFCPAGNLGKCCHFSINESLCLILFLSDAFSTSSDSGTGRHPCGPSAGALGAEVGDRPPGGQGHVAGGPVLPSPPPLLTPPRARGGSWSSHLCNCPRKIK